jgi:hypothetical protein
LVAQGLNSWFATLWVLTCGCCAQTCVQRLLVVWRAVLAGATKAVDYSGALLNYAVVGAAVFAGGLATQQGAACPGCLTTRALEVGDN